MTLPALTEERMLASIEPKSDQLSYDDFIAGPRTFKVAGVAAYEDDKISVRFVGETRVYRPSKSMRRVLVLMWTSDGHSWVGRSATLYGDPTVMFGGIKVGGIKISHMSDIEGDTLIQLTVKRGKKAPHKILKLVLDSARKDGGTQGEGGSDPSNTAGQAPVAPSGGVTMSSIKAEAKKGTVALETCVGGLSDEQRSHLGDKMDVLKRIAENADLPEGLQEKLDAGGHPQQPFGV